MENENLSPLPYPGWRQRTILPAVPEPPCRARQNRTATPRWCRLRGQASLFYRIAAFVLLGAAVICGVVDYIMTEGRHMHWSLLVLIGTVGVLAAAARTAAPGPPTPLSCCSRF